MRMLLLPLLLLALGACAQGRLDTDRPDQTESTTTVPAGAVQLEAGAVHSPAADLPAAWSLPQALFRLGLSDRIELRAEGEHMRMTGADGRATATTGPMAFGAKVGLGEGRKSGVRTAALMKIGLPRPGSRPDGHPFAGIVLLADRDLGPRWSMGANLGMEWNDLSPLANTIYSLTSAVDLSQHFGAFAEIYGAFPEGGRGDHRWDGGVTWAVGGNMLFDASLGHGFQGQGWFFGAGFSFRVGVW